MSYRLIKSIPFNFNLFALPLCSHSHRHLLWPLFMSHADVERKQRKISSGVNYKRECVCMCVIVGIYRGDEKWQTSSYFLFNICVRIIIVRDLVMIFSSLKVLHPLTSLAYCQHLSPSIVIRDCRCHVFLSHIILCYMQKMQNSFFIHCE